MGGTKYGREGGREGDGKSKGQGGGEGREERDGGKGVKGEQLFVCVSENSLSIKAVVKGIFLVGVFWHRAGSGRKGTGRPRVGMGLWERSASSSLSGHQVRRNKNKPINRCLSSWP